MSNYYYLISSLPEIQLDTGKKTIDIGDFIEFCCDELDLIDFNNIKKVFIFNDIKNAIYHKKENYIYYTPSYYLEEVFQENLKDTDSFFSFIGEYFYYHKNEKRIYPRLMEVDEIVTLFYENIDQFCEGLLKEYFLFELDMQNVTTALTQRTHNINDSDKIIPHGDEAKILMKSTSPDFGLAQRIYFMEELIDVYKENDLVKIEKTIEEIRWNWLDERLGFNYFSLEALQVFAIKLLSVERWSAMTDQKGEECINLLIEEISANVQFKEAF